MNATLDEKPKIGAEQMAARLGVCRATVYRLVKRGELPHLWVGNRLRFDPQATPQQPARQ